MALKINIKTIPHKEQRYPTVGDWYWEKNGSLQIRISDMKNWKYEALVALHECIEVLLCKDRKISQDSVDKFDISFEKLREEKPEIIGDQEPGDMISAPYNEEHKFATDVERRFANELKVNWNAYDKVVSEL